VSNEIVDATHGQGPINALLFMGVTGGRRPVLGLAVGGAITAALPALLANLALELARP
jgi:hypothetical protein